ncbi:MAG: hypothetical protein JW829_07860 [Pirellulales bacterium]|nr:hypothetical protein [Pirellulales bacterium]
MLHAIVLPPAVGRSQSLSMEASPRLRFGSQEPVPLKFSANPLNPRVGRWLTTSANSIPVGFLLAFWLAVAWLVIALPARAAEPELVGFVAMMVEEEVAKELDLTQQQRDALERLIEQREDEGLELALRNKDLPPDERAIQLAPFRAKSQELGLSLLNKKQRAQIREIVERRTGDNPTNLISENSIDPLWTEDPAGETDRQPEDAQPVASSTVDSAVEPAPLESSTSGLPPEPEALESQDSGAATLDASDRALGEMDSRSADDVDRTDDPSAAPAASGKMRFSFRFQPWRDVLDWFAQQADLSIVMDSPPQGTFNYVDTREYTPEEALDLLNSVLLTKGYTLVRRGRMLMVINLDDMRDGVPPNLVPVIPLTELDERGEYELVRVVFTLNKMTAEEARAEIESLLGPQGSTIVLPKSRRLQVTDTAGRLRVIRSVFEAIENPMNLRGQLRELTLNNRLADEILPIVRQMLGMADESNALPDGSLRIAVDLTGQRLIVQGDPDKLHHLESILELLDVPGPAGTFGIAETPQIEVYTVSGADPASVLAVLQTLLAGDPNARLGLDPQTGNIVALARPSQHATIRATIAQMQRDARQIDVIPLSSVDPQVAVLAINKLFSNSTDSEKQDPTAPKVDADLTTRSLMVRASPSQLVQIRDLLEKLGESLSEDDSQRSRSSVRLLPLTGRSARSALYQIEQVWPTLRPNRIRVVTPSASGIPTFRPGDRGLDNMSVPYGTGRDESETGGGENSYQIDPRLRELLPFFDDPVPPGESPSSEQPAKPESSAKEDATTRIQPRIHASYASQELGQGSGRPMAERRATQDELSGPTLEDQADVDPQLPAVTSVPGSPILIAPGPGGVLIASQDLDALDDFEELITSVANRATSSGREFAVYYLRYAKANVVAETVTEIFGGSTGGGGGGGGILGDIAGAALGGGPGGDLVGNLLGLGGGGGTIALGAVDIVPDTRLNALVVRGKPADLDTLEQLLHILDQPVGPEDVQVDAPPRMIPVYNTKAEYVAGVVRQVYEDRLRSGSNQQRQPSPEELIRALRGSTRGRGSTDREQEETTKMSIGVDTRSNSIVVRAPDPLFEEVKKLVAQIDLQDSNVRQATQILSLKSTNPSAVQEALTALFGQSVQVSGASSGGSASSGQPVFGGGQPPGQSMDDMRRRMEFFQRMQGFRGQFGQPGGQGGPFGGGGRSDRGGSRGGGGGRGGGR